MSPGYSMIILLLIIIIFLYYFTQRRHEHLQDSVIVATLGCEPVNFDQIRSFYNLTDGEKLDYIVHSYMQDPYRTAEEKKQERIAKENEYIKTLPQSDVGCSDQFTDCGAWAKNDECIINPEFMLYSCPQSCKACTLSEGEKYNLTKIYNNRDPPHCAYQTGRTDYPNRMRYITELEKVHNELNVPI